MIEERFNSRAKEEGPKEIIIRRDPNFQFTGPCWYSLDDGVIDDQEYTLDPEYVEMKRRKLK